MRFVLFCVLLSKFFFDIVFFNKNLVFVMFCWEISNLDLFFIVEFLDKMDRRFFSNWSWFSLLLDLEEQLLVFLEIWSFLWQYSDIYSLLMIEQLIFDRLFNMVSYSCWLGFRYLLVFFGILRLLLLGCLMIGVFKSWLVNTEESLRGSLIFFLFI